MASDKIYLSWKDIEVAVEYAIHVMAYNHYKPIRIVGLSRGGLIPATMIAHRLGIPEVDALRLQLREGRGQSFPPTTVTTMSHWANQDTLFVDDLWDSGATMQTVKRIIPEALTCTLYYKAQEEKKKPPLNFPGMWMPMDPWLVFPWETVGLTNATRAAAEHQQSEPTKSEFLKKQEGWPYG